MADRYIFSASEAPQSAPSDFTGAATGGTLTGASATVELVFDDAIYGATNEGKQRLVVAVKGILAKLESAKVWPITSSS